MYPDATRVPARGASLHNCYAADITCKTIQTRTPRTAIPTRMAEGDTQICPRGRESAKNVSGRDRADRTVSRLRGIQRAGKVKEELRKVYKKRNRASESSPIPDSYPSDLIPMRPPRPFCLRLSRPGSACALLAPPGQRQAWRWAREKASS